MAEQIPTGSERPSGTGDVFPDGPGWTCTACHRRYPEDHVPDRCECGHGLTRILARLNLG